MESHHDGDETKGSVHSFVQDHIEAREASRSVRTAGPKDLTVTSSLIRGVSYLEPGPSDSYDLPFSAVCG